MKKASSSSDVETAAFGCPAKRSPATIDDRKISFLGPQTTIGTRKLTAMRQKLQLLLLRRQRQTKHRLHALPGNIHLRLSRSRQVERLAVFAAIDFGI